MTEMNFDEIEFAENSDSRAPLILCLDVSGSMMEVRPGDDKSPIEALDAGLDSLVSSLASDPLAKRRCEISIVTYSSQVNEVTDFKTVDQLVIPELKAGGLTATGAAINASLDKLEERKKTYRENGISMYRPFLVLLTDGLQTDDVESAAKRLAEYEDKKKVAFFPVGIAGFDPEGLKEICPPGKEPLALSGLKFDEFFQWLSASQSAVSSSAVGDKVPLPNPSGWAEI